MITRAEFMDDAEKRFGTDKALGVQFVLDDTGETLSAEDYDALCEKVGAGKSGPGAYSVFPGGGSAVCCTDYAVQVCAAYKGRAQSWGFANIDNPSSRVAREQIHAEGHDFAVVDGRFVVDAWLRLVASVSEQIVFDMKDKGDAALIADIYGDPAKWGRLAKAEPHPRAEPLARRPLTLAPTFS
jgi:hypothetical protein